MILQNLKFKLNFKTVFKQFQFIKKKNTSIITNKIEKQDKLNSLLLYISKNNFTRHVIQHEKYCDDLMLHFFFFFVSFSLSKRNWTNNNNNNNLYDILSKNQTIYIL